MLSAANPLFGANAIIARRPSLQNGQSGIILPIALFVLVAATILTLALVKTNMISLRIGGTSVIAQEAQTSAELLLSNFFTRNPTAVEDGKYERPYTPCSTGADNPDTDKTVFDCRQISNSSLPAHTVPTTPDVQRIGCGMAPRSNRPTQVEARFNYNQVVTGVDNTFYGSRAAVGTGVGKLVIACP